MKVAFYFTLTCNARCEHCCTEAGPQVRRKMSLADARAVVASIARVPQIASVVFTGGESFLHRRELLQLVRDCTDAGLRAEVVTNGFWATSAAAAREVLAPFRAAGLGVVRLSVDRWHLPYVAPARVHTAINAVAEQGFVRNVLCVIDAPHYDAADRTSRLASIANPTDVARWDEAYASRLVGELQHEWPGGLADLLALYDFDVSRCVLRDDALALSVLPWEGAKALSVHLADSYLLIQYQLMATEGRARAFVGSVPDEHVDRIPEQDCTSVMYTPTISPEGDLFPCCSSWVNHRDQAVANVRETAFDVALEQATTDPIALFMHYQGPATLLKYLRVRGGPLVSTAHGRRVLRTVSTAPTLPDRYTHPCHVCGTLLDTFTRAELIEAIRAYYDDYPARVLFPVRGFDPANTADLFHY